MQKDFSYTDALKILGEGDSRILDILNGLLGGAILASSAATGQVGLLGLLEARDEVVKRSRTLLVKLEQRVRGATGKGRTDLLIAAHAIVAVNAYFEALGNVELAVPLDSLKLTGREKLTIVGGVSKQDEINLTDVLRRESIKLTDALLQLSVPIPTPSRPYEQVINEMRAWYQAISRRMLDFVKGFAWAAQNETKLARLGESLLKELPDAAARQYDEDFRALAVECLEFKMWVFLADSAASRSAIGALGENLEIGLAGLQNVLDRLATGRHSPEWPTRLSDAYEAQLNRPIVESSPGETGVGLVVPAVEASYINPRLLLAEYSPTARPAEESWWNDARPCDDVQRFLAGYLTSPTATEAPLVVLGQPGSGKSLLTKVLAARLPPNEYLPIRVELRRVPADAPLQDQIEFALREATGERMDWPELLRQAGESLAVVMLDGFDELLQSTGVSHSSYLEQVRDFQRREITQGRRVAFIVTSRTVVANRVRFPEGTVVAKIESFDDSQVERWLRIWNSANSDYFNQSKLQPLAIGTVLAHRDLAEQPLLLLMLTLYDAYGNALQQYSDELVRAGLYEGLLTRFVDREIDKRNTDLSRDEKWELVDTELDELSVVAFAMFNRGRKSVSQDELDIDLGQLLPQDEDPDGAASTLSRRLSRAQLAIGRFFFIYRSQAMVDGAPMNYYEFLHSTFGEYLVARLLCKILAHMVDLSKADKPSRAVRSKIAIDDDRLWDLLSFTSLTDGSQIVAFATELIRKFEPEQRGDLDTVLATLFRRSLHARERGYSGYDPRRRSVPARHAIYSANLLILNVCAAPQENLRASTLFGFRDSSVTDSWRSHALLWKSQFNSADWDDLITRLEVSRVIEEPRDLIISYKTLRPIKSIDRFHHINWIARDLSKSGDGVIGGAGLGSEAIFLCDPQLDLLMHALQPLLKISQESVAELLVNSDGNVQSAMYKALSELIINAQLGDERGKTYLAYLGQGGRASAKSFSNS